MGMAASQARYLALVARKSNCEYEGQQINQARTALANQSANLFNQMLGLQVPVPPNTQDFTKVQYSFKDGMNASTITNWEQLSGPNQDYNYVVTHHYYTDQYTGSQKMLNDPQVQFSDTTASAAEIEAMRGKLKNAEDELAKAEDAYAHYIAAQKVFDAKKSEASNLSNHATLLEGITEASHDDTNDVFTVTIGGVESTFVPYDKLKDDQKASIDAMLKDLGDIGVSLDPSALRFNANGSSFAKLSDLDDLVKAAGKTDFSGTLNTYSNGSVSDFNEEIENLEKALRDAELAYSGGNGTNDRLTEAKEAYEKALEDYNNLGHPEYIGNCELTPLGTLTADQEAEIRQIITDMKEQGITSDITNCYYFDEATGKYTYTGGLYSFKLNGNTYYTTYSDLQNSYLSGTGINNIDGQTKLPYYNASYVSTKVEKTEKALLETDGSGRFTSIRFEDNSITYTLAMETVTDEAAYEDAMNQYYYEDAKYDKMIQDINAKTSLIHQEDKQLELRLKQLDTVQNALSQEMDAVQKVVKDNVEKSFKTFGG